MTAISFEFYPPKTEESFINLQTTAQKLKEIGPQYFSVTYGASGSTRTDTGKTVNMLKAATHTDAVPHIAGIGSTHEEIDALLNQYQHDNIKKLVVLRGDLPQGIATLGDFTYAHQLVSYIRKKTGDYFRISVAAYPETHPEAATPQADIDNLKRKMDAGANDIITQYFFNPESYFYFRDQCVLAGISSNITVGVMPITSLDRLARFSEMCGAEIPLWIRKHLQACGDDKETLMAVGKNILIPFCHTLKRGGAPGFHFYTLNQANPSFEICQALI